MKSKSQRLIPTLRQPNKELKREKRQADRGVGEPYSPFICHLGGAFPYRTDCGRCSALKQVEPFSLTRRATYLPPRGWESPGS